MDSSLSQREPGRHQNRLIFGIDVFCQLHAGTQLKKGNYCEAIAALLRDLLSVMNTGIGDCIALNRQSSEIGLQVQVGKPGFFPR